MLQKDLRKITYDALHVSVDLTLENPFQICIKEDVIRTQEFL